jgi:hypothetical protein
MKHLPKSIGGWLVALLLVVPITVYLVMKVVPAMENPVFWAVVGVAVLAYLAWYARRRRVNAAREAAWVDEFSFGDVVRRLRAEEAAAIAEDGRRRRSALLLPTSLDGVVVPVKTDPS